MKQKTKPASQPKPQKAGLFGKKPKLPKQNKAYYVGKKSEGYVLWK